MWRLSGCSSLVLFWCPRLHNIICHLLGRWTWTVSDAEPNACVRVLCAAAFVDLHFAVLRFSMAYWRVDVVISALKDKQVPGDAWNLRGPPVHFGYRQVFLHVRLLHVDVPLFWVVVIQAWEKSEKHRMWSQNEQPNDQNLSNADNLTLQLERSGFNSYISTIHLDFNLNFHRLPTNQLYLRRKSGRNHCSLPSNVP